MSKYKLHQLPTAKFQRQFNLRRLVSKCCHIDLQQPSGRGASGVESASPARKQISLPKLTPTLELYVCLVSPKLHT